MLAKIIPGHLQIIQAAVKTIWCSPQTNIKATLLNTVSRLIEDNDVEFKNTENLQHLFQSLGTGTHSAGSQK